MDLLPLNILWGEVANFQEFLKKNTIFNEQPVVDSLIDDSYHGQRNKKCSDIGARQINFLEIVTDRPTINRHTKPSDGCKVT